MATKKEGVNMKHTKTSLIVALFATMKGGETHYTKASVDALRGLLKQYHDITVGRRWMFSCLRCLIDQGIIRRKERYRHDEGGEIRQISSLISFTLKGVRYMVSRRIAGAKKLLNSMIVWWKKKDARFPKPGPEIEKFTPLETAENIRRVKDLVFSL